MKRKLVSCLVAATIIIFAVILTRSLMGAPPRQAAHQTKAATTSPQVTHQNGEVIVHLNRKTQARLGIREAPLKAARERKRMALPAVVLPVAKLASLDSAYDAAGARLQKAEITAKVSHQEYQRLKKLYREQQNVSEKAVQAAAGVYSGDQVDVRLARQDFSLAAAAVRQSWGEAITEWLAHNTGRLRSVLRRDDVLVEMTLPPGASYKAPPSVEFKLPLGGRNFARLVSPVPQLDPRVQGVGYLYITRSRSGLAPGLDLVAHFGVGPLASGVIVPASAVVWLNGDAWAYVAEGPGRFVRRRVATSNAAPGGWFVTQGFQPGGSVVTQDAQQILAVELMATHPSLGTGEGDDD